MQDAFYGLLFFLLVLALIHGHKRDSTDSAAERSGLTLYTDHATGVQYVGTLFGSLTVRVDKNGKPYSD